MQVGTQGFPGIRGADGLSGADAPTITIIAAEVTGRPDVIIPGQPGQAGGCGGKGGEGGQGACDSTVASAPALDAREYVRMLEVPK